MKFFRILLLFMVVPLLSGTPVHKFYVSITKIEYAQDNNSLQIITKIFIDDIENALRKRYDPSLSLDTKNETEEADELLKKYILQKLKIEVNGAPVKLDYLGQEYDNDLLVAYIEITDVKELKTIEIENKVLMDMFPEQQNIIHLKTPDHRKSLILDKGAPRGTLNF